MAEIDLSPDVLDLVLYAGDGVRFRMVVKDTQDPPQPVPLTGTVEAEIRTARPDLDPEKAVFSVDLTDFNDGIAVLSLTGSQTQALVDSVTATSKKFTGVWDVQWTPENAEPKTLCQGKVECWRDVTR